MLLLPERHAMSSMVQKTCSLMVKVRILGLCLPIFHRFVEPGPSSGTWSAMPDGSSGSPFVPSSLQISSPRLDATFQSLLKDLCDWMGSSQNLALGARLSGPSLALLMAGIWVLGLAGCCCCPDDMPDLGLGKKSASNDKERESEDEEPEVIKPWRKSLPKKKKAATGRSLVPRVDRATWTPVKMNGADGHHVLDIDGIGPTIVVATFGQGLFVSQDLGQRWRRYSKPPGKTKGNAGQPLTSMGSDYLGGVDIHGGDVWVRSIGHGFGVLDLQRSRWRWWASKQLRKEFLFPTAFGHEGSNITISTADGLWDTPDNGRSYQKRGQSRELPSEYVMGYARVGDKGLKPLQGEWVGLLQGLHHIPVDGGKGRTYTLSDGLPSNRVEGVHVVGQRLYVLTDGGLAWSDNVGRSWTRVGEREGLPSRHVHDMALGADNELWVATFNGLARLDAETGEVTAVLKPGGPPARHQVNAVHVDADGRVLAGTSDGLWIVKVDPNAPKADESEVCVPEGKGRAFKSQNWPRPIASRYNAYVDQTYMFGQTWGGQFGVHRGFEFNNAEGTPVLAVAPGEVVMARFGAGGANVVSVRHDEKHAGQFVYTLYIHLSTVDISVGERVKPGTMVGTVGHTGAATNDHLHFEVRLSNIAGNGMSSATAHNPALFLEPMPGRGTIAGIVRRGGKKVRGAQIYGPVLPEPDETPFGFFESYGQGALPLPGLGEDFAILDVPAGIYPVRVRVGSKTLERCVRVEPGQLAWADFSL